MSFAKITSKHVERALKKRQEVLDFILASDGVEIGDIRIKCKVMQTPARNHLKILLGDKLIAFTKNPHRTRSIGATGRFHRPGIVPTFPAPTPVAAPANDFHGQVVAPAVQVGAQRDPLVAALFGAAAAWEVPA
jgi:hypothetical protein